MAAEGSGRREEGGGGPFFPSTHWSVLATAVGGDSHVSQAALERLCRDYWTPLFRYIRSRGHGVAEAEDLTQEFLAKLVRSGSFAGLDPAKGRFRSWLLTSLRHFLIDDWERRQTQRRGGGVVNLPLDSRWQAEQADPVAAGCGPEAEFDRQWAMAVLERSGKRLRDGYAAEGGTEVYEVLKEFVSMDPPSASYAEVADRLGMSTDAVRSAIFRLRRRYQRLVREVVAETVASPVDVDDELRHLITVLRGG